MFAFKMDFGEWSNLVAEEIWMGEQTGDAVRFTGQGDAALGTASGQINGQAVESVTEGASHASDVRASLSAGQCYVCVHTKMPSMCAFAQLLLPCFLVTTNVEGQAQSLTGKPWVRHVIDASSKGADGVKLADVDKDGLPDVVTGWEEGGTVRVYRNPGPKAAKQPWPAVTVGKVPAIEDAVLVDLDGDGAIDVVSSAEGRQRSLQVHWAPKKDYWRAEGWRTEAIPAAAGKMMWMFATPADIAGKQGVDLIAGGKNEGAELGWWEVPVKARELTAWQWHTLRPVGWIMSIVATDMDGDGDLDVLFTDRKGKQSGCFWLEHPGKDRVNQPWREHAVGALKQEAMFLTQGDVDRDGLQDVIVAVRPSELLLCRRLDKSGKRWQTHSIPLPTGVGQAKGIALGDINGGGRPDLIGSCEHAEPPKSGVFCLEAPKDPWKGEWLPRELSGPAGVKFDLLQLLDLDRDGDMDVLTCEERHNLGVIWYENPLR